MSTQQVAADIAEASALQNAEKWVARSTKPTSPKLTFEAYEAAVVAATKAVGNYELPPSSYRGFEDEARELLLGKDVKTLQDANSVIDKMLKQVKPDWAHANARKDFLCAFKDGLNSAMEVSPSRAA